MNARPQSIELTQGPKPDQRWVVLQTMLRVCLGTGIVSLVLVIAFPQIRQQLLVNSIGFILGPTILLLIGKRLSIAFSCVMFVALATFLVVVSRGILPRDPAIVLTASFLLIIPGAGLLLGRGGIWPAVITGIASTWADALWRLSSTGANDPMLLAATCLYCILFVVCGLFMEMYTKSVEAALDQVRGKERTLALRNADLEHEVVVRNHIESQLLKLTGGQQAVLDAAHELLACATRDDLWRRAVELARERLGVERCAIFLLSDDGLTMHGTFGTDLDGLTTDEHKISFNVADSSWANELDDSAARKAKNYWSIQHDAFTTEWRDDKQHVIGQGWVGWTPLRSRTGQRMGVFFNDTQRTGTAPDASLQDAIAIYCAQISNIAEAKRLEDELKQANADLELRVQERTEQLETERDHLEVRVIERTHELSRLIDASKVISSTLDLQPLLKLILKQLEEVLPCNASSVAELHETELKFLSVVLPPTSDPVVWTMPFDKACDVDLTMLLDTREPVLIADALGDGAAARALQARFKLALRDLHPNTMGSVIHVPLLLANELLGLMTVRHPQRGFYNESHVSLMRGFASFAAIAIANARLHEEAVQTATSAERTRLSHELHDSVSQALFGIILGSRTALEYVQRGRDAHDPLQYVLSLSEGALAEMRALIFDLRPESLAQEGLVAALRQQAQALVARHKIGLVLELCETEPDLPIERKEALYRIVLEAIQNTLKHAEASQLTVRMRCNNASITVDIQDDGRGFVMQTDFPGHYGLVSMRERAQHLGGDVHVTSAPRAGTTVSVCMPVTGDQVAQPASASAQFASTPVSSPVAVA